MRTFATQAERMAYYDGARDMMKAFELADPSDYAQMLSTKSEQCITTLALNMEDTDKQGCCQDIRALLKYGSFDKDDILDFITSDPNDEPVYLHIYYPSCQEKEIACLRSDDKNIVFEAMVWLVELGDEPYIEDIINTSNLPHERRSQLQVLLSKATCAVLAFSREVPSVWRRAILDSQNIPGDENYLSTCDKLGVVGASLEPIAHGKLPTVE